MGGGLEERREDWRGGRKEGLEGLEGGGREEGTVDRDTHSEPRTNNLDTSPKLGGKEGQTDRQTDIHTYIQR